MRILLISVLLVGCQSPPDPMPQSYLTGATQCVTQVSQGIVATANNNRANFTDARDMLLAQAITALADQNAPNPYGTCFAAIEAYYQAYGVVVTANSAVVRQVFQTAELPLSLLAGGKALDWVMGNGGTQTIDASNSDLVIDSGNRGTGNTVGRSGPDSPNVNVPNNAVDNTDNSTDNSDSDNTTNSNNTTNDPPPEPEL